MGNQIQITATETNHHEKFYFNRHAVTGAVMGCGFNESSTTPTGCGYGMICFGGKRLTFRNLGVPAGSIGALVSASIQAHDATETLVYFSTPAGRNLLLRFREVNGVLTYDVPHSNWRKQFCYSHTPAASACALQSVFGVMQYNCSSPLIWYDDAGNRVGGTKADAVTCP